MKNLRDRYQWCPITITKKITGPLLLIPSFKRLLFRLPFLRQIQVFASKACSASSTIRIWNPIGRLTAVSWLWIIRWYCDVLALMWILLSPILRNCHILCADTWIILSPVVGLWASNNIVFEPQNCLKCVSLSGLWRHQGSLKSTGGLMTQSTPTLPVTCLMNRGLASLIGELYNITLQVRRN